MNLKIESKVKKDIINTSEQFVWDVDKLNSSSFCYQYIHIISEQIR